MSKFTKVVIAYVLVAYGLISFFLGRNYEKRHPKDVGMLVISSQPRFIDKFSYTFDGGRYACKLESLTRDEPKKDVPQGQPVCGWPDNLDCEKIQ